MRMILSPEFQRQLWTKITPVRLMLVPLLLALGLSVYVIDNDEWAKDLLWPAMNTFIVIVFIWGSYDASVALRDEIKGNTWDFQRMSSIGPWQMGMGKLFGATSYVWVFGAMLLAVMAVAYSQMELEVVKLSSKSTGNREVYRTLFIPDFADVYFAVVLAALTGMIAHLVSFWGAVMNLRQRSTDHLMPFILGMIAGVQILQTVMSKSVAVPGFDRMAKNEVRDVTWWGMEFDYRFFALCMMLFAIYWLMAAIYRTMRLELGFRNTPVVWGVFCLSLMGLYAGFMDWSVPSDVLIALMGIGIAMLGMTYVVMLAESDNISSYRRWWGGVRKHEWRRVAENTPKWMVSAALMLVTYMAMALWQTHDEKLFVGKEILLCLWLTATLLMVRDGLVVHGFALGRRVNRSKFGIIVYYTLVYALLPFFVFSVMDIDFEPLQSLNPIEAAKAGNAGVAVLFFPTGNGAAAALPVLLLECAGAWLFMRWRLKRLAM